jgi:hypothetical protein
MYYKIEPARQNHEKTVGKMEQYEIPPRLCNKVIQTALKYFEPEYLFIRWVGSLGGKTEVAEELEGKKLNVHYSKIGFEFFINNVSRFLFKFSTSPAIPKYVWGKQWAFAYQRFTKSKSGSPIDVIWVAATGYPYPGEIYTDPDDPRLPKVRSTVLRCANATHLVEITFKGEIPIIKTGTKISGIWDYYTIDMSRLSKKLQKPRK